MKYCIAFVLFAGVLLAACAVLIAQGPSLVERPFKIVRLDPALDDIIAPDAKLETLGEHFGLSEGPVWIQEGNSGHLLFSDCAANVIYKWAPGTELSVFLENSGFTGRDNLNVGQQTITGGRVAILLIGPTAKPIVCPTCLSKECSGDGRRNHAVRRDDSPGADALGEQKGAAKHWRAFP